ncbi:MAG: hypothetical protein NT062_17365 [Proteobacteria bacterium]|nr:hypothetical protein [Pseudomonadota bacterium]
MNLKAIMICEDVRLEVAGTLTIVGAYNDRLIAPPGEGPINIPRLTFLAVVGGLRGIHQLGVRQQLRAVDDPVPSSQPALDPQPHDPQAEEHNFVFSIAPVSFPSTGAYEAVIELDTGARQATYRYRFQVERAKDAS